MFHIIRRIITLKLRKLSHRMQRVLLKLIVMLILMHPWDIRNQLLVHPLRGMDRVRPRLVWLISKNKVHMHPQNIDRVIVLVQHRRVYQRVRIGVREMMIRKWVGHELWMVKLSVPMKNHKIRQLFNPQRICSRLKLVPREYNVMQPSGYNLLGLTIGH